MKMNPWTLSVLLLLAGPLGAAPDWGVEYPDSFCVVEGSTATIPCSFTPPAGLRVNQVMWCLDQLYCLLHDPNVYDSSNVRADSRFLYLGDGVRNCTLKIIKTVKRDAATYRFSFKTNGDAYTVTKGVRVTVTDGEDVEVRSSVTDNVVKEGGQVTLTCTSACSFHQSDVHWYRNGHALSETGPALHLSDLTNDDTGNYSCSLDSSGQITSEPWSLMVLEDEGPLGAAPDWGVEYPDSFCVVEGSTATIPCSFTHPAGLRVNQVGWCPDDLVCQGYDPNMYESSNIRADSRFLYLGDLVGNCTLKIIKTVKRDAAEYHFSFETNVRVFTGPNGVRVTVTDGEDVEVRSSVTDNVVKEGGQVTLTCTSACSFHQSDVHWYRNGHALSETGPALHFSDLTNGDTGNYSCSLDSSGQITSEPWSLMVLEDEGFHWSVHLKVAVVKGVVLAVLSLLAGVVFAKWCSNKTNQII